jgi:hypothetical protein
MLQGKRSRRIIAATLLTIMLTNTLAPTVTYALTSGPTQPEATSFEPVDTTDMVNLQTGNFTYNLPLLEVPGPEGGYPLSLSYHAGIQTNEDASWVGLGWTLNPGAINRNVNGYPDDWQAFKSTTRTYWAGGTTTTYSPGVSIGLANSPLSVNVGLSFSNDTYQGFGMTMDVGVGISASLGSSPLIGNMNLGVSSTGQGALSAGIGAGYTSASGLSGSVSANVSSNFESLQAGFTGGMGIGGASLLQASMATNGDKPVLTTGGYSSSVTSSTNAQVQTHSSGWHIDVPTPVPGLSASFGYSKTRYWTDETTNVTTKGSIYNDWNGQDDVAYDSYSLLEDPAEKSYVTNPDPTVQQGGAYPAFDNYEVNAQGLSGNMRPYQFQGMVFAQNRKTSNPCSDPNCDQGYSTRYASPNTNPTPQFRFVGDFSNRYLQEDDHYSDASMTSKNLVYTQPLPFSTFQTGEDGTNKDGFKNNQLAGSKHIEVGIKIQPNQSQRLGYNKADRFKDGMIEGFTITNSSGVRYTFGLPAYTYNEESYQEKRNQPADKPSFNRQVKNTPYAYTWYLTSITGPDYVDRNGNGPDAADWGYWVNFEYGKWADNYAWRTPSEGYNADEDNEWQNCSMGYKEVYYLNAIRTRTHVALFEKEVRADAKGSSPSIFDKKSPHPTYSIPGSFGGESVSSLRLSHIYLMNASDGNLVTPSSGTLNGNVLDATDIDAKGRTSVDAKAIRIIDFHHDYSLCRGTRNSFFDVNWNVAQLGKLTLKYISTRGRNGDLFPPMKFEYDPEEDAVQAEVKIISPSPTRVYFSTTSDDFKVGDLIMSPTLNAYLGVIVAKSGTGIYTYSLANGKYSFPNGETTLTIRTTKNPPYNNDAYDAWGMYKSDFNTALLAADLSQGRSTSAVSAPGVDAWSLRSITTELGNKIKINYEPDSYFMPPTEYNKQSLMIDKIDIDASAGTMTLRIDKGGDNTIKLSDSYVANDNLSAVLLMDYYPKAQSDGDGWGGLVVDTRTSSIEFCDVEDNHDGIQGLNLGNYPKLSLDGTLKVLTVDDVNNTINVQCTDQFLLGNQKRTVTNYRGSNHAEAHNNITRKNPFGGNLFIKAKGAMFGGGIRVTSLAVVETFTGVVNTTNYDYNNAQGKSSGVSVYTPSLPQTYYNFPASNPYSNDGEMYIGQGFTTINNNKLKAMYVPFFKKSFLKNNGIVFTLGRDLPPPGVMYGNVTVSNYIKNPAETKARRMENGKTEFQFEVFRENMVARVEDAKNRQNSTVKTDKGYTWDQYVRYYSLYKFISCLGNTKKVTQYDEDGRKLTETVNEYLHDDLFKQNLDANSFFTQYKALLAKYNSQGYIKERYGEAKSVSYQKYKYDNGIKSTLATKEEFPCISKWQTVTNYVNGTSTKIENLAYDFYSGDLVKSVETDAYGNHFMTETVPAYRKYANTELGLKINDASNLNMLTQTAARYLRKVELVNGSYVDKGLVSASVTTWSNGVKAIDEVGNSYIQNSSTSGNGNVWRIQSAYSWLPKGKTIDGLSASFTDFNWSAPNSSAPEWKKTSEISLYDVHSHALESSDMNGNYVASKMDYGNKKVILSGSVSKYDEIAFSGAEDASVDQTNDVFVKKANGVVSTDAAHTGNKSLKVGASGNKGFVYTVSTDKLTPGRTYIASVWVKPVSGASDVKLYYTVNGVQKSSGSSGGPGAKVAGGWSLINFVVDGSDIVPNATLTVGCRNDAAVEAYLDDFRFKPLNGSTSAYVYDAFTGELTYVLDNSNLYSKFEYDGAGRLVKTYREKIGYGQVKTNEYQYNYGRPSGIHYNEEQSGIFTRECISPKKGSKVTYTIPKNTYFSEISVGDANQKAIKEINTNGQLYATYKGTCLFYNEEQHRTFTKMGCPCFTTATSVTYTVPADKYSSDDNWLAAQQMATDDVNANGQSYAQEHGECIRIPNNVKLTLVTNCERRTPPTSMTIVLSCTNKDGSLSYSFPVTNGRTDVYVPSGFYNVKFNVTPDAWYTCPCWSIDLWNGSSTSHYSNPRGITDISFSTGTDYVLTATLIM